MPPETRYSVGDSLPGSVLTLPRRERVQGQGRRDGRGVHQPSGPTPTRTPCHGEDLKEREKQIERVINNSVGLYGDMQGVIGGQIPTIDALELESEALLDGRQVPADEGFCSPTSMGQCYRK